MPAHLRPGSAFAALRRARTAGPQQAPRSGVPAGCRALTRPANSRREFSGWRGGFQVHSLEATPDVDPSGCRPDWLAKA